MLESCFLIKFKTLPFLIWPSVGRFGDVLGVWFCTVIDSSNIGFDVIIGSPPICDTIGAGISGNKLSLPPPPICGCIGATEAGTLGNKLPPESAISIFDIHKKPT